MKLRTYQVEAVQNICKDFGIHDSLLLVMATGTGKTVVLSYLVSKARKGRVLVLAHREELIRQLADTLGSYGLDVGIEMADRKAGGWGWRQPQVVVATVQTLVANNCSRLERLVPDPDRWSLTVIDEAHHAPADSYRRILEHMNVNKTHRVLGVTATPDRADKLAMGSVFDHVTFEYNLFDAVRDGFLCPIRQRAVFVESLDFSKCRTTAGDLNGKDLSRIMEMEHNLHQVATPTIEIASGRKSVVFCVSVEQAERLAEIFNRHEPGCARCVSGTTPKDERRQLFKDFDEGKFQFLTNCMVATEGWDCPSVQMVVMARPTKSRSLYAQMLGRGTRPLPGVVDEAGSTPGERRYAIEESDKPVCEVLDFAGNAGRHHLVTVVDLMEGDWPEPVRQRAAEIIAESDEAVDPEEALEQAQQEAEEQARKEAEAEAAKRAALRARAKYRTQDMNPFDVLDIQPPRRNANDGPSTDKQIDFLMKFGLDVSGMTKKQAGKLQREVFRRMKAGLCTIKQARVLKKHGYPTDISKEKASQILDRLFGKR